METVIESKTVVIIGGGVAGLTAANLLQQAGIDAVVLERREREYVERRQRAGVLEARAVRMFEQRGLGGIVAGAPAAGASDMRIHGDRRVLFETHDDKEPGRAVPQQVLVINLIENLLSAGGDIRFGVGGVALDGIETDRPVVRYVDPDGIAHEIRCRFIAGADGDLGVSRSAIPDGVLTSHSHDYGYAWLSVLADVPVGEYPLMGIHERGFAAQFARGRNASRFYLQVPPNTSPDEWSDEQIWSELGTRFADPDMTVGSVLEKNVFPLRSVVYEPMRHENLFLLGDSAHIIPPASSKGANLAIFDADVFASAVRDFVETGDRTGLDGYSDICLANAWNYQEYAVWVSEMLHDAGDPARRGTFRQKVALARLERLYQSGTANRLYTELLAGTN